VKPKLPAAVYALGLTSLLNDAAGDMIYPLLPVFLTTVVGAGAAALGVIEGAAEAMASFLKLGAGYLSDRVRRRKPFVVAGYVIASVVRPLTAFAGSAGAVLAIRVTDRFGKGMRSSPRDALIADVVPPGSRAHAFGVHEAMDNAGAVVGPLAASGLLALGLALPSVFLAAAVPGAIACLVVVLVVREPARAGRAVLAPEPALPSPAAAAAAPAPPAAAAALSRPFLGYLAAVTLFALGNSSDAFLLLRAHEVGLPATAAPLLWALHNGVKAVAGSSGGVLADRIGRRRALALGWLVYAAIYTGFAVVRSGVGVALLFAAYGLHFALVGGAQKALVADLVPPDVRARGYGAYYLCVGLALLPASALFGVLYQRLGAGPAFGTGAVLSLLAIALLPLSRLRAAPASGHAPVAG
jgi:MFS family permease